MDKQLAGLAEKLKKDRDILAVSIFGSFARGEKYKDIDICLFLEPTKSNSQMTKKRLKYLSNFPDIFDIQIFQQLPIVIRQRVLKEGNIIFCRNENKLFDTAYLAAKEYEDFSPVYNKYIGVSEHA